jgi:uncharacterized membrane protein YedE/YeeE
MKANITAFIVGIVFAMGFGFAGLTRPETIIGFLDFTGDWQHEVMLVMGAAVIVTFITYRLIFRRSSPVLAPKFGVPTRRDLDGRLITGAVMFGAGWGLIGFCPGPAIASLASGSLPILVWLAALVAGMLLFRVWDRMRLRTPRPADVPKPTERQAASA